ncbi:DUF5996 family protein [Altererythrobacter sp. TH136]|uniref:DUF5996 family protein n=1 Tax=Altererythrobacter sp. TH136 TaxID=2067415 RepID=UPI0011641C9D|nr:DUF5996 family protein [Altererythrobacter sp. TH136]QDM39636.1 hypothetical protein C0V74_00140 [Altererythrobacter sp. TH136]
MTDSAEWPSIPFEPWKDTCAALHLYAQIVGKYRLAHTPWVNHSWHATLYVNADGLTTGLIPDGPGVTVQFDLQRQRLIASCATGKSSAFALEPMTVAEFDARFKTAISTVGGSPSYHGCPNELPEVIPFADDTAARLWDAEAVSRFHRALVRIDAVFNEFRTGFLGKVSPVHLFWGSFDLAVTRFSGRAAPLHPGGIPNLPDTVTQEAYSHEVSSAGFWPGGGGIDEPCFYSYAYPSPADFSGQPVRPGGARFDNDLGEFILPYEAVRSAPDPRAALLEFLHATYDAAAMLAGWDKNLTCALGQKGVPRIVR